MVSRHSIPGLPFAQGGKSPSNDCSARDPELPDSRFATWNVAPQAPPPPSAQHGRKEDEERHVIPVPGVLLRAPLVDHEGLCFFAIFSRRRPGSAGRLRGHRRRAGPGKIWEGVALSKSRFRTFRAPDSRGRNAPNSESQVEERRDLPSSGGNSLLGVKNRLGSSPPPSIHILCGLDASVMNCSAAPSARPRPPVHGICRLTARRAQRQRQVGAFTSEPQRSKKARDSSAQTWETRQI